MYIIRPIDYSEAVRLATNGEPAYVVIMNTYDEFMYLDLNTENIESLHGVMDKNKCRKWFMFASEFEEIPLEEYIDIEEGDVIFTYGEPSKVLNASELIKMVEHVNGLPTNILNNLEIEMMLNHN